MRVSYNNKLNEDSTDKYIDQTTFSPSNQDSENSIPVHQSDVEVDWDMIDGEIQAKLNKNKPLDLLETLDLYFCRNRDAKEAGLHQFNNLLVQGDPGSGKTAIIEQWAQMRGVRYLKITGAQLTASIIRGLPFKQEVDQATSDEEINKLNLSANAQRKTRSVVKYLRSTAFDLLQEHENSVLFIDEINRSDVEAEAGILTLIQSHAVPSDEIQAEGYATGEKIFDNFLFTVAAENPIDDDDNLNDTGMHSLSTALLNRFSKMSWESTPESLRSFFEDTYDAVIDTYAAKIKKASNEREKKRAMNKQSLWKKRQDIASLVLSKPGFSFKDQNGKQFPTYSPSYKETQTFSSRSLTMAINLCDGRIGTVQSQYETRDPNTGDEVTLYKFSPYSFLDCVERSAGAFAAMYVYQLIEEDAIKQAASNANQYQNTVYQHVLSWAAEKGISI